MKRLAAPTLAVLSALSVACLASDDVDSSVALRSDGPIEGTYLERVESDWPSQPELEAPLPLEALAPTSAAPGPGDRDGDGVADFIDTCPDVAAADNYDADGDGLGNACDADYNGNGVVDTLDFAIFFNAYNSARGGDTYDARADHNVDGYVTGIDFATFLRYFGGPVPPLAGVVPFESVQAGDTLSIIVRYGDGLGNTTQTNLISSITRDAAGKVRRINIGAAGITVFVNGAWMIENLLFVFLAPTTQFSCARGVAFPDRAIGSLSQTCTPVTIHGISISASR